MTLRNVPTEVIDQMAGQSAAAIKSLISTAELVRTSKKPSATVNFFESFFKQAKKHILI
jgi:GTP-binding protein EngB required for normal cell division